MAISFKLSIHFNLPGTAKNFRFILYLPNNRRVSFVQFPTPPAEPNTFPDFAIAILTWAGHTIFPTFAIIHLLRRWYFDTRPSTLASQRHQYFSRNQVIVYVNKQPYSPQLL